MTDLPQYSSPAGPSPHIAAPLVALRPLGAIEIVGGALRAVWRHPRTMIGVSLIATALAALIAYPITLLLGGWAPGSLVDAFSQVPADLLAQLSGTGATAATAAGDVVSQGVLDAVTWFATVVVTGVLVRAVADYVVGADPSMGSLWETVRPRLATLFGASILASLAGAAPVFLALVIGALLAVGSSALAGLGVLVMLVGVVLSIIVTIRLVLAPVVAVIERQRVVDSLRRSWTLVTRSSWRTFGVLLLAGIAAAGATLIVDIPFSILLAIAPDGAATAISIIASVVTSAVGAAILAGGQALLYIDLRMRKENLAPSLQAAFARNQTVGA